MSNWIGCLPISTPFASMIEFLTTEKLQNALFMVGEIGGNDYNYAIFQGNTMDELRNMVPDVVDVIMNAARAESNWLWSYKGGDSRKLPNWMPPNLSNSFSDQHLRSL